MNGFPSAIPWYKSKVIVGAAISIIAKLLVATGLIGEVTPEDSEQLATLITTVIGGLGDLMAIGARLAQKAAPAITAMTTRP